LKDNQDEGDFFVKPLFLFPAPAERFKRPNAVAKSNFQVVLLALRAAILISGNSFRN